jgi:hypothetical protein
MTELAIVESMPLGIRSNSTAADIATSKGDNTDPREQCAIVTTMQAAGPTVFYMHCRIVRARLHHIDAGEE